MPTVKVQDVNVFHIESNNSGQQLASNTPTMKNSASTTYNSNFSVLSHLKYEHLIAGISGGAISTLILHPLDLMKIRFAGSYLIYRQFQFDTNLEYF